MRAPQPVWIGTFVIALLLSVLGVGIAFGQDDTAIVRVGVVIQGPDGPAQTYCVQLSNGDATGLDALLATGVDISLEQGTLGASVCRVGSVGCVPPEQACFCQCQGGNSCAYWAYFQKNAEGNWQYSALGAQSVKLESGSVQGWWWRDGQSAVSLPRVTFESICGAESPFPRVIVDDLGREVTIPAPPERIASVTLASDEILLDLVGPERLLGVTYFAANPAISNVATRLDGVGRTDLIGNPELLISLDADLVVLSTFSNPAALDQLLAAGVPLIIIGGFNSFDDIRDNIRLLGEVTGTEARAEALIARMDAVLADVQARVADQKPVRVLYYELGGISYGEGSTIDEVIRLAGGVNVVAEAGMGAYPLINPEFILAADPDVVLLSGGFSGSNTPLEAFLGDPIFATLRAVKSGRVYTIDDAHLTSVSHHLAEGVWVVAQLLYPQAFAEDPSIGNHSS